MNDEFSAWRIANEVVSSLERRRDAIVGDDATVRAEIEQALVPLRAGYRFDEGAKSHSLSAGLGYIDTAFGAEIAVRRVVSGDPATAIVFGFSYHLDSGGLTQGEGDSF